MATSDVKVTPGSGKNVGTYSITEDAETKELQRVVLNTSAGTEVTGFVSTVNSTTTPLAANATFNITSPAYDNLLNYAGVSIVVTSDQNGTLQISLSNDASTIVRKIVYTFAGGTSDYFFIPKEAQYISVGFTNASLAQGTFVLQTILHSTAPGLPQAPMDYAIGEDTVSVITRSTMVARTRNLGAVVDSTVADATGSSVVINVPAATVNGDMLVASVISDSNVTFTPPSGWALIESNTQTTNLAQSTWYRVASSEPASYTWNASSSHHMSASMVALSGIDLNTIPTGSGQANASSTSITAPSLTTSVNSIVLGFFSVKNTSVITAPTGWTQVTQDNTGVSLQSAYNTYPLSQATGTITATAGTTQVNIGQLILLKGNVTFNNLQTNPANALLVGLTDTSGNSIAASQQGVQTIGVPLALKTQVSGAVTYYGLAPPGTAQSAAAWRAFKVDTTSGTVITWAGGNALFDNVATDLSALTYS